MASVEDLTKTKVGFLSVRDNVLLTASKVGSDLGLSQVNLPVIGQVGNSTFKSGMIKAGLSTAAVMTLGNKRYLQALTSGVMVDGLEDLIFAARNRYGGNMASQGE